MGRASHQSLAAKMKACELAPRQEFFEFRSGAQ
jgi:hypothetical protein